MLFCALKTECPRLDDIYRQKTYLLQFWGLERSRWKGSRAVKEGLAASASTAEGWRACEHEGRE